MTVHMTVRGGELAPKLIARGATSAQRARIRRKGGRNARPIAAARLDKRLEILARRPDLFAEDALRLCAALDARRLDLEIADPNVWRGATGSARVTVENQLSTEIAGMRTMSREQELKLALRIEFATIRLQRALEQHGLDVQGPYAHGLLEGSTLPPTVVRRRLEWHALRLEMVERNLYLVLISASRYSHTSADRSDLIQAAAAAMFRAVDGFDWRRRVLFRTYAVHWLNEGLRSHCYNFNRTVRVPTYLLKSIKHVNAAIQRLGDPHASVEEIASNTGLRTSTIAMARAAVLGTRSLDAPLERSDGTRTLASDLALPDDGGPYSLALDDLSVESGVEEALDRLSDRERLVVKMRFGIGYDRAHIYAEVAEELGVSLERARQILVRAMSKMRTPQVLKTLELLVT